MLLYILGDFTSHILYSVTPVNQDDLVVLEILGTGCELRKILWAGCEVRKILRPGCGLMKILGAS